MKNLKLLYERRANTVPNCKFFTFDCDTSIFYLGAYQCIKGYSFENFKECFNIQFNETEFYCKEPHKFMIVGLEFLCGEEQLCVATKGGDILLCNTTNMQIKCVGTLDCELHCMSWSPDQETVLFVTSKGSVVVMNHDFDPITEIEESANEFGEESFVNVGWGSKETQFQGSAGKYVPGKDDTVEADLVAHDDQDTKIVWRGDSQYFAISAIESFKRKFRVWNREGELQYTSEPLSGLESCFAWKPSGSLIASSQRKVHRYDIVFFEMNGLQHGEFTLPFKSSQTKVVKLCWNCDSTILALCASNPIDKQTFLQLWTVSNYHWFLKQSIEIEDEITCLSWDVEQPFILHVLYQSGVYRFLHWSWCLDSSRLTCFKENHQLYPSMNVLNSTSDSSELPCLNNKSLVCVIEGAKVNVTPFKYMIVPPPMFAMQMTFKENVKSVCYLQSAFEGNTMGVLLNSGKFVSFIDTSTDFVSDHVTVDLAAAGGCGFSSTIALLGIDQIFQPDLNDPNIDRLSNIRHLVWHEKNSLTAATFFENQDYIVVLLLNKERMELSCAKCIPVSDYVIGMCFGGFPFNVLLQFKNGNIFQFDDSESLFPFVSNGEEVCLTHPCYDMQLCRFGKQCDEDNFFGIVALSFQNRLFLNNIILSTECTSFYIHQDYIMFTTSSHKLFFKSLLQPKLDNKQVFNLSDNKANNGFVSRSLERGSRLVVVTPFSTKTVLQLPRGNLEVIHPRPLVLSIVKHYLDNCNYTEAFCLMRKHRINMNLFHDHNPITFFANIPTFIKCLASSERINLFLGELLETDVMISMYKEYYPIKNTPTKSLLEAGTSKLDKIIDAILVELSTKDSATYCTSILTAYIKYSSPDIGKALTKLKQMKDEKQLDKTLVNHALRHVHVMVDGPILYKEALGTYDLDLTLTVAQLSNKDPKEYVPFLNELKGKKENLKRYEIDMYLKKYDKALENVSKCPGHFSKFIELVTQHNLHRKALTLFEKHTSEYKQLSSMYAEVLASKQRCEEAGIILARCNNHKRAVQCFIAAGCWQHAFNSAASLQYSKEQYYDLGKSLAEVLIIKRKFLSASSVLEAVSNYKEAVSTLCNGRLWSDAHRLVRLYDLHDMVDTCIVPSLKKSCADIQSALDSYRQSFDKYYLRLQEVREIKRNKLTQAQNCDLDGDLESDIASDFGSTITDSSVGSTNSRTSRKTAKSRRKQERKRISLRPNSRYEEEGLLNALKEIYTNFLNLEDDIHPLLLHMSLHFLDDEAAQLQKLYISTQHLLNQAKSKIWVLPDIFSSVIGSHSTVNDIIEYRTNPPNLPSNFDDLAFHMPPTFKTKSNFRLHLYSDIC